MRILAIRGENLASLAAPFEIDFTREPLAGAGLFAITGETGAGKSTVLDALCLALYGEYPRLDGPVREKAPDPSGVEIGVQDSRALLRRGAARGFAEVDFQGLDGIAYRAHWGVARARGRADGNLQPEQRRLIRIADEQPIATGKSQVLEQVRVLSDLTFAQFSRTVLLAQGDFDAFLLANENERAELLEKVTGTEIYAELSRRAHAQTEERSQALRRLEQQRDDIGLLDEAARRSLAEARIELVQTTKAAQESIAALQKTLEHHARIEVARERCLSAESQYTAAWVGWDAATDGRALLADCETVEPLRQLALAQEQARNEEANAAQAVATSMSALTEAEAFALTASVAEGEAQQAETDAETLFKALGPIWTQCEQLDAEIKVLAALHETSAGKQRAAALLVEKTTGQLAELESEAAQTRNAKEETEKNLAVAAKTALLADRAADVEALLKDRHSLALQRNEAQATFTALCRQMENLLTEIESMSLQASEHLAERDRLAAEAAQRRAILAELNEDDARRQDEALVVLLGELAKAGISFDRRERASKMRGEAEAVQARAVFDAAAAEATHAAGAEQYSAYKVAREEITALVDLADATLSKAAVHLRASLVPHEPCPVCGSGEHPHVEGGAAADFVAQIRARRIELDTKLEQASHAIETAKGLRSEALARGREAVQRITEADTEEIASAKDYAELLPSLMRCSAAAGIDCEEPHSSAAVLALATQAQSLRATLAPGLDRAKHLRADIETFRRLHEAQAAAADRAAADLSDKRNTAQTLAGRRSEAKLLLQHLNERFEVTDHRLAPYLAAADATLAELDDDSASVTGKLKALGDAYRKMRADFAQLDQRLRDLEPACAAAREAKKSTEFAVLTAEDEVAEHFSRVVGKRDERAALLDGELTGSHRTRHNEARRRARETLERARETATSATKQRLLAEAACHAAGERGVAAVQARHKADAMFESAVAETGLSIEWIVEVLAIAAEERDEQRRRIEGLKRALAEAQAYLGQRKKDLGELLVFMPDAIDAAQLGAEIEQKQGAIDDMQRRVGAIDNQIAQDDVARADAATLSAEIAEARVEFAVWQAVNEAIGSASGDKFRRFAQGITLDHLVRLANRQLSAFAPRYALARTDASELALSVIDRDMGAERRGTRSLSGGERFLVSLSLAIALSSLEGRQSFVDTLFIDEGFGSLDAETLDVAIDALECLHGQGRKVGIITHVAAMIERIAVQVRVEKRGNGRSAVAIRGTASG